MIRKMTRRNLLKLIAASAAAATLAPAFHARASYPRFPVPPDPGESSDTDVWAFMGRAIHTVAFYAEPSTGSGRLDSRARDQAFPILGEVRAPFSAHNDLWYKTPLGYVHSAWVLPVRVYPPQPFIADVGEWGFWGEVSQIYTDAYAQPSVNSGRIYRFYGSTVYHVIEAHMDEQGTGWYKVYDEFPPTSPRFQWVMARDVRRIPRREMSPINPFVGNKRIEVDLGQQRLTCLEGDHVAFTTLVASGLGGATATPTGEMHVLLKQASRHMSNYPYPGGPEPLGDLFDLPGVPWNIFFDLSGTAIHGAYWHNDYGVRRSHGCLNVSADAARFIYRWCYPIGGFEDDFIQSTRHVGTPVIIF
ncbi:MAG: L,D-transpeptidase [Chloroflexi bacterium]|nr:L,D-transpeptidase [Chloroflexota bacterium]